MKKAGFWFFVIGVLILTISFFSPDFRQLATSVAILGVLISLVVVIIKRKDIISTKK